MPFIGQQPITGAYHKLDSITTSATATYNLQLNGGAYYPTSANHLLVSLNGVMQAPQDSFTVSGSQITFASALTSSDNIDFIMALGDVLNIGVPSDGTVNTSQLANSAVTDTKLANTLDLSSKALTMPTGSVLQVQYTQFSGTSLTATTAGTWGVIPDINVNITPSSTNSKIMVQMFLGAWEHSVSADHAARFGFYRDSSLLVAPAAGSRLNAVGMGATNYYDNDLLSTPSVAWITYFDEPSSTSQITYKGAVNALNSGNFALNRTVQDTDASGHERTVSSIVVTEIAG
jgi:hypothetical protein